MATRKRIPARRPSTRAGKGAPAKKAAARRRKAVSKPARGGGSARRKRAASTGPAKGARKTGAGSKRRGTAKAQPRKRVSATVSRGAARRKVPPRRALSIDKTELIEPSGSTARAVRRSRLVSGATADMYIASQPPPLQPVLERLRALILEHAPQLTEEIKWGQPTYSHERIGNVMGLMAFPGHVNLTFFAGEHLADPSGLLTGTGKGMRHVSFRSLEDVRDTEVTSLIREAVADVR